MTFGLTFRFAAANINISPKHFELSGGMGKIDISRYFDGADNKDPFLGRPTGFPMTNSLKADVLLEIKPGMNLLLRSVLILKGIGML